MQYVENCGLGFGTRGGRAVITNGMPRPLFRNRSETHMARDVIGTQHPALQMLGVNHVSNPDSIMSTPTPFLLMKCLLSTRQGNFLTHCKPMSCMCDASGRCTTRLPTHTRSRSGNRGVAEAVSVQAPCATCTTPGALPWTWFSTCVLCVRGCGFVSPTAQCCCGPAQL